MFNRVKNYCYAKYRAFAPLSCGESHHADVLRGWRKWRWLTKMRSTDRLIDPSILIRCQKDLDDRLILHEKSELDQGTILWLGDAFEEPGTIELGARTYVGPYTFLGSCHRLETGADCMIGSHCYIITVNHRTDDSSRPYSKQGYRGGDIKLGKNVWLGSHVVVLPGVQIGDDAVIGAGAVVNKDVPAGETWGGVPARPLNSSKPID